MTGFTEHEQRVVESKAEPLQGATKLVWTMLSPKTLRSRLLGAVMNIDTMVGGDFEKGLAALKRIAERE